MKRLIVCILGSICLSTALLADEYDTMRQRLLDYVALGTYFDATDADVKSYLTQLNANTKKYWEKMEKTPASKGYLWSEYSKLTGDASSTPSHVWYSYDNLRTMARAWAVPSSNYYHNADLLADIKMGLDFLYTKAFNAKTSYIGNWYNWRIGIPEYYGHIVTILYDQLSSAQLDNYAVAVGAAVRSTAKTGNLTFANQANVCQELITLGIISKNANDIQDGINSGVKVFVDATSVSERNSAQAAFENCWKAQGDYHKYSVLKKEGYYPDGTFIQHIALPYIGAYGLEQIEYSAFLAQILEGTSYTISSNIISTLPDIIQRSYLPAIYKGEMMYMFMGRSVATNAFLNAGHILKNSYITAQKLLGSYPEQQSQIVADCRNQLQSKRFDYLWTFNGLIPFRDKPVIDKILAEGTGVPSDSVFALYYPCGDRLIHQTKKFRFGLSLSSSRIGKFESINNMNTTGWYTGDGMYYVYLPTDSKGFVNYFTTNVNWYRLPGITVDPILRSAETDNYGLFGIPRNAKDHVGGLTLNSYSMAAMYLVGQVSDLETKKAWFCFEDEIVCLGAGVSCTAPRQVESIVEGRKSKLQMYLNNTARVSTKGKEFAHEAVETIFLTGTGGYWFPKKPNLLTYVSYDGYSYIYYRHSLNPQNEGYEYVLLPGMSQSETEQYAKDKPVYILKNDINAQGVVKKTNGVAGINFWKADSLYAVTSDGPACVMFQQIDDYLYLNVCDPTQKRTSMVITLDGDFRMRTVTPENAATCKNVNGKTILTVNVTNRWGQAVAFRLKGELKVPDLPDDPSAVNEIKTTTHDCAAKYLQNGQLRICRDGVTYNAMGAIVK